MYDSSISPKADISAFYSVTDNLSLPINVYLPRDFDTTKKYKTVIAIHGGSWHGIMCSPENWDGGMLAHTANYYVNMGYVGITFSYRDILFSKSTSVEDLISDCLNALNFIKEKFDFIDTDNLIFLGESAGGHLCLSLIMELGEIPAPLMPKTAILYNPVTDCTVKRWRHLCTTAEKLRMYSPMFNAKKIPCNLIIVHGALDTVVPVSDSIEFCNAMNREGNTVNFMEIPDGTHSFALFNYKSSDEYICNIYEKVNEFLI